MRHVKPILFLSLCGFLGVGALSGITTPRIVQAHIAQYAAEHQGDVLFHFRNLGTNGLSCDSCHVDGGRFSHRLGPHRIPSLVEAKALFPQAETNGQVRTLETQINLCLVHAMNGHPLSSDSRQLGLLDLYLRHLSRFHER